MIWSLGKPLPLVRFSDGKTYDNFVTEGWMHERSGRAHQSLDMRATVGTPAYAVADGTVVFGGQYGDGSGGAVELDHGDFATRYLHLSRVDVARGARVRRGQRIGLTGYAVSPHLHWDIWALPSAVAEYIARFGRPVGIGQTKSFSGKTMTKIPGEPLVPASYQPDVVQGALKGNVKLYRSTWKAVAALGLLGLGAWAAWRYFRERPALPASTS